MINSIIRDYSEKRDFIRMKVDTQISLSFENSDLTMTAVCKDLSGTGMLIETDDPLAENSEFHTSLPSSNPAFPAFETKVKVIRCEESDNGKFLIGAEILNMP
ncbi:PilZ domain-containing protein [Alkalimarinus sediminis]|uniref:PilZ domain-containing protein n=1 Tax=Alkalimarinus sediminis TaxID=1632866 RepID=A0A9E8KQI3_9ALTE|nr:PilZ domain-containing protein [Alkalimarinus sediminis]UZW76493.1 PilZ domain-containing protein [Alkalimarinus sediminis]